MSLEWCIEHGLECAPGGLRPAAALAYTRRSPRHAPTAKIDRLVASLALQPPTAEQQAGGEALYHLSPYPLVGTALLCSHAMHGVMRAIWASPSYKRSALHVCRSLRHHAAIVEGGHILYAYRFPAGSPQYAMFSRFALPSSPGEFMYSTAGGGAKLRGRDVPMVIGEHTCQISTVNVRAYFDKD